MRFDREQIRLIIPVVKDQCEARFTVRIGPASLPENRVRFRPHDPTTSTQCDSAPGLSARSHLPVGEVDKEVPRLNRIIDWFKKVPSTGGVNF